MSPDSPPSPAMRADARRNRSAILAAADEAFSREGLGVPVDEIARRAGVGPGTLYRHFPTKEALFEAVLLDQVTLLAEEARDLAASPRPGPALFDFMARMAGRAAAKRNLIEALSGAGVDVGVSASEPKAALESAFESLLLRAQAAGDVRPDVTTHDLFALVMGFCAVAGPASTGCSTDRMLSVVCDGLRPAPGGPSGRRPGA